MTGVVQPPPSTETIDFGGIEIAFDERLLRPRPWTTAQSRWAASLLPSVPEGDVLELCSGAGQIGLLAIKASDRRLVCVDVSPVAASYTLRNAATAGLSGRVSVREGLIANCLGPEERFPIIIADPPWVPRAETHRFPEDPLRAIDGGDDGLSVVRECTAAIGAHLAPGGVAILQLGNSQQVTAVASLLEDDDLVLGEVREYGERGVLVRIEH